MPKPTGWDAQSRKGKRHSDAAGKATVAGVAIIPAIVAGFVALMRDSMRRWAAIFRWVRTRVQGGRS